MIKEYQIPYQGFGYYHEIEEVNQCLREGKTESDQMPLSFSLDLIGVLDKIRAEIGLEY